MPVALPFAGAESALGPEPLKRAVGVVALALIMVGCASSRPAPIADRPINLKAECSQTEEDGFREQARLLVTDNRVDELSWQLWVGQRGSCRFMLPDFRQVSMRPSIELIERNGGACRLLVWQSPQRITLAHAGCEARCDRGIYEEAWPVMFDPDTGRCATR